MNPHSCGFIVLVILFIWLLCYKSEVSIENMGEVMVNVHNTDHFMQIAFVLKALNGTSCSGQVLFFTSESCLEMKAVSVKWEVM